MRVDDRNKNQSKSLQDSDSCFLVTHREKKGFTMKEALLFVYLNLFLLH